MGKRYWTIGCWIMDFGSKWLRFGRYQVQSLVSKSPTSIKKGKIQANPSVSPSKKPRKLSKKIPAPKVGRLLGM